MLLSREHIAQRILAGQSLLVFNGNVLRVPQAWLDSHPGGALAILHFVGRDASDEIRACHNPSTIPLVERYIIGKVAEAPPWDPFLPPIAAGWLWSKDKWTRLAEARSSDLQDGLLVQAQHPQQTSPTLDSITPGPTSLSLFTQKQHSDAYNRLHQRVIDAGLYDTPFLTGYGPEVCRYLLLGTVSAAAYYCNWLVISAIFLGLMWHQLMFFAHDLGHMGVTHSWTYDRLISIFVADFVGGLSIGWWVENHNVHHLVTNHPSHDPDIEHLPFFAISPAFFSSLYSTYYGRTLHFDRASKLFVSLQHKLFYIVMLFARFNLYRLSYLHLFSRYFDMKRTKGRRWAFQLELCGVMLFWIWFGTVLYGCGSWQKALTYLVVSHITTSPLHVQIVLSHFSMSTDDLGPLESFPHRQLRTTSDVICPSSMAFIHGGLHLQVTHHLFPRLPRHNLAKASELVKQYAKDEGLNYAEFGFVDGNKEVFGILSQVAHQVGVLTQVAQAEAREAVDKKIQARRGD